MKSFQSALHAGVAIATGTDAGSPDNHHGKNATELELMVDAGMSPIDVILAATNVSSACVGLEDRIGTLEKGKFADIIAVREDPLSNISA
ncbi:MAG: amidohydrolase family protein, partial [Deltaproteobacteria bacterium]|nr:amidohydrolase family protein [Deltaproteobacteria bacterium]